MCISFVIEDDRWPEAGLEAVANRAAAETLRHLSLDPDECEITLLACDDARIAELNADFRGKPQATNVLSWPEEELAAEEPGGRPEPPEPDMTGMYSLGDIAIAYDTCKREADEAGKVFSDHVTHLIVHGLLHLLGYDHVRDDDATLMEGIEITILGKLGLDDPYSAVTDGP